MRVSGVRGSVFSVRRSYVTSSMMSLCNQNPVFIALSLPFDFVPFFFLRQRVILKNYHSRLCFPQNLPFFPTNTFL